MQDARATSAGRGARFRNRLVHLYWDVDDDLVLDLLQEARPALRSYGAIMGRLAGG